MPKEKIQKKDVFVLFQFQFPVPPPAPHKTRTKRETRERRCQEQALLLEYGYRASYPDHTIYLRKMVKDIKVNTNFIVYNISNVYSYLSVSSAYFFSTKSFESSSLHQREVGIQSSIYRRLDLVLISSIYHHALNHQQIIYIYTLGFLLRLYIMLQITSVRC